MAIKTIKKALKPKILFGMVLNSLESNLYRAVPNIKVANEILRESLNLNSRRLIQIVDVVNGNGDELDLLVVYDAIISEREEQKLMTTLKVEEFNFHIFNFNKIDNLDLEQMVENFKQER